jgi:uncharacterized membrane protein
MLSNQPKQITGQLWPALGLATVILLSTAIGLYAVAFQLRLAGAPEFFQKFDASPVLAGMHVIGGAIVLLVGGLQFWRPLRRAYPTVHRWLGRLYLTFVLVGGIGGLALAPQSNGGVVTHFGFGMLAVLWLFSGWQAYSAIRRGDVQNHQAWMMRNFALTFGAVTLRIYLGLFALAGVDFASTYQTVAWLSWVPNLIFIEWYVALASAGRQQPAAHYTN